MTNSNPTPHGIGVITATQWEIERIKLKERRSVRHQ